MIYGGFELSTPNIPTDSIHRINLTQLFQNTPTLSSKINALYPNQAIQPPPIMPSTPSYPNNPRVLVDPRNNPRVPPPPTGPSKL